MQLKALDNNVENNMPKEVNPFFIMTVLTLFVISGLIIYSHINIKVGIHFRFNLFVQSLHYISCIYLQLN